MAEQLPLFAAPAAPPRPAPKLAAKSAERPSYARYAPVHRVVCDDCVRLVHQLGVLNAPVPAGARWTRRAGDDLDRLCHEHKAAREEAERR